MSAARPAHLVCLAMVLVAGLLAMAVRSPDVSAAVRVGAEERRVAELINVHRTRHRRPPLRLHRGLVRAARAHARAMGRHGFMSHYSRDGTPFDVRVERFARPRILGEVLARIPIQAATARAVVRAWLRSPPHRAIILSDRLRRAGVARIAAGGQVFYVADLGAGFAGRVHR